LKTDDNQSLFVTPPTNYQRNRIICNLLRGDCQQSNDIKRKRMGKTGRELLIENHLPEKSAEAVDVVNRKIVVENS